MHEQPIKYKFGAVLYANKAKGLYLYGFSGGPNNELAIAVAGWTEGRKAFRFHNFVPVDINAYASIAHNPRKDFDFIYKGQTKRFSSTAAFADYLNTNKL